MRNILLIFFTMLDSAAALGGPNEPFTWCQAIVLRILYILSFSALNLFFQYAISATVGVLPNVCTKRLSTKRCTLTMLGFIASRLVEPSHGYPKSPHI